MAGCRGGGLACPLGGTLPRQTLFGFRISALFRASVFGIWLSAPRTKCRALNPIASTAEPPSPFGFPQAGWFSYPPAMRIITDELCTSYRTPGHPERPERISRTQLRLRDQETLAVTWEEATPAPVAALTRAHDPQYLGMLEENDTDFDLDTPWHDGIYDLARRSAGAALQALAAARRGETVFSLMRPPGHHATRDAAMGFCYLGNAAIATQAALAGGCRRVAVYDFDVHHGNGTEDLLLGCSGAVFASVHQYPCFPGSGTSDRGTNVFNHPLPPLTPRQEYRQVLTAALERLVATRPELLIVSAGFDAYEHDPIAQETLTVEDFHWLGQQVRALDLPVCSLLEGGYSHDLPELIFAYLCGLAGK